MTPDKQATTAAAKPEATAKHTVGDAPIYVGTVRYDVGASVELTVSQANHLGTAVKLA